MPETQPLSMDDESVLGQFIPATWFAEQEAKRPFARQMLYWTLTHKRGEAQKRNLVRALSIIQGVLASDPLGPRKKDEFIKKLLDESQQEDMAAELAELVFLSKHSTDIVYAPEFPNKGPDFRCQPASRPVELEVTKLSGTEVSLTSKKLRYQLDLQLYEVPSGLELTAFIDSIRTQAELTASYRTIKGWVSTKPGEGEHELAGGLRMKVWRTDGDPEHTLISGHGWRGFGLEKHEQQILRKIARKAGQLTGLRPGLLVMVVDDLESAFVFAGTIKGDGQAVLRNHPKVSGVILVQNVTGQPGRRMFRNMWATHPLNDDEAKRLVQAG